MLGGGGGLGMSEVQPGLLDLRVRSQHALENSHRNRVPEVVLQQHAPLAPLLCPIQRSFETGPPSGSVEGKLTEAVTGKVDGSVVVTVSVTEGGRPGLGAGETVTYSRPWAPPPRPSATDAS